MGDVTAIIAAAGQGRRMASIVNKQFLLLQGKPVLAHTLDIFDKHPLIKSIVVITAEDQIDNLQHEVLSKFCFNKEIITVIGGQERQDSVYNGLMEVRDSGLVIIHDGARPFLTTEIVSRSIEETHRWGAVAVGMPVKDTIKVVDQNDLVELTPERSTLWLVQTPQCFEYTILRKAYEQAQKENFLGTDDASLVERMGVRVKMIKGSYENIKVTTTEDLIIGEAILANRKVNLG